MANSLSSSYARTYTSFAGADIVATFNGKIIGELLAVSYSVTREKAPIYTMGCANPRAYSRGKRGIAGSLVFAVFDRDALAGLKAESEKIWTAAANRFTNADPPSMHEWNANQQKLRGGYDAASDTDFARVTAVYADEIPPFDITITMKNEYGQAAKMALYGVEIINEGMGVSVDDITTEKACTFVARAIEQLEAMS